MTEIIDIIVIALLTIAITYGFILNRRITLIQESKKELANLFKSFDETILKAQKGIEDLKLVSNEISDNLQNKIDKAAIMIDDLEFLNEKAVKIGKKIEGQTVKQIQKSNKPLNQNEVTSLSPEEILQMRKQKSNNITPPSNQGEPRLQKEKALESLLKKISSENKLPNNKQDIKQSNKPQEQEKQQKEDVGQLLKALGYGE